MAENSRFWTTSGTGDGPGGGYSSANMIEVFRTSQVVDETGTCVLKGKLNELAVTGTTSPVAVASGVAWVYGMWYQNDASLNVTVATPVTNPRIDRIVLRYGSAAQTVRITRLAGTEAASPTAPTLTQNSTTYEVSLAQVRITTGGVVTVTDERGFITDPGAAGAVDGSTLTYDTSTKKIKISTTGTPTIAGLTTTASSGGGNVQDLISNTSNTANSNARAYISVAGASAGDASTVFDISGVQDWAVGSDNSDSDKFKVSASATLGTNDALSIDTSLNSTFGGNVTASAANSGANVTVNSTNTSNTASSNARLVASVGGSSAGDPFTMYDIAGVQDWVVGVDNSDGDKFKISASNTLGTSDEFVLDSSGNGTLSGALTTTGVTSSGAISGTNITASGTLTGAAASIGGNTTSALSSSGGTVQVLAQNTSNTANSNARLAASVAGASAADPYIYYEVSGVQAWSEGIDNSDSDKFKIASSGTLGTNDRLTIDTSGNTTVAGSVTAGTGLTVSSGSVSLPAGSVAGAAIADNAIDDTKVGDRVPQFYRRQGGDPSSWHISGTNNYTPSGGIRMQGGVMVIQIVAGTYTGATVAASATVTFPQAFSNTPIVYLSVNSVYAPVFGVGVSSPSSTTFGISAFPYQNATLGATITMSIDWLAVGPE